MIAIYEPDGVDGFEWCLPIDEEDWERVKVLLNGTPRKKAWKPFAVELMHEDEGLFFAKSDSPWWGSEALVFRKSAVEAVGSLLVEFGELLALDCSEADLFVFNATRLIDALDEKASVVKRFSTGKLMRIVEHVFKPKAIAGVDIFKIPNLRVSPTFVSDRIVKAWEASGLEGLQFKKIWSSS